MRAWKNGPQLIEPPSGALEDFDQIITVSEIPKPVQLGWVHIFPKRYESFFWYRRSGAVAMPRVADLPPLVVCSTWGVERMGHPLVLYGSTKDKAHVTARRFLLGHEAGHLRQFERGEYPEDSQYHEDEAHKDSCEVFRRLGCAVHAADLLTWRLNQ